MVKTCIQCGFNQVEEVVEDNRTYFYCLKCEKLYGRVNDSRYGRDVIVPNNKGVTHLSVGGFIRNGDKFLLTKRRNWPFGYGFPSGHVEYKENIEEALKREILEETALDVIIGRLLFKGEVNEQCRYGANFHIWHFFECIPKEGVPIANQESESLGWFSMEDIKNLDLVPAAEFLLSQITV